MNIHEQLAWKQLSPYLCNDPHFSFLYFPICFLSRKVAQAAFRGCIPNKWISRVHSWEPIQTVIQHIKRREKWIHQDLSHRNNLRDYCTDWKKLYALWQNMCQICLRFWTSGTSVFHRNAPLLVFLLFHTTVKIHSGVVGLLLTYTFRMKRYDSHFKHGKV